MCAKTSFCGCRTGLGRPLVAGNRGGNRDEGYCRGRRCQGHWPHEVASHFLVRMITDQGRQAKPEAPADRASAERERERERGRERERMS